MILDTVIPVKVPTNFSLLMTRLRISITMINRRGDIGQPCQRPLSLWKKADGSPLIITT
jgi:hypothetical protein